MLEAVKSVITLIVVLLLKELVIFASDGATPAVGSVGKPEEVPESRIEFECHADLVVDVIDAINHVHPYEEVPIDVSIVRVAVSKSQIKAFS